MKISKIEIKNFKSFKDVSVDLNDFNVVVGACASGKSNFIEAFKFLKDVCIDLEYALVKHGSTFMQNINLKSKSPSCINITIGDESPFASVSNLIEVNDEKINTTVHYNSIDYELCINFNEFALDYINETVRFNFTITEESGEELSKNSLFLINNNGEISAEFEKSEKNVSLEFFAPESLLNIVNNNFKQKLGLMIDSPLSSIPISWSDYFKEIHSYNFDPKLCKIDGDGTSKILSEYGHNLPTVLEEILSDDESKHKFLNLISTLLPYVENIDVNKLDDNHRVFHLVETYNKSPIFALFVSDGTANILALITALYFSKGNIILIEEPERNIHPGLLITLVEMMKEVANPNKQIIISTHSPEILDYCNLEDILLISRDDEGFSNISKPVNNATVNEFVEQLGIGDVFLNDYLGLSDE